MRAKPGGQVGRMAAVTAAQAHSGQAPTRQPAQPAAHRHAATLRARVAAQRPVALRTRHRHRHQVLVRAARMGQAFQHLGVLPQHLPAVEQVGVGLHDGVVERGLGRVQEETVLRLGIVVIILVSIVVQVLAHGVGPVK